MWPTPSEQADRYQGALLGLAVGDALGFPLRGVAPSAIARLSALTEDFAPKPRGVFAKGQFTDDTQLALAVLESVAAEGRIDGRSIAAQLASLWKDGTILEPPKPLDEAARRLVKGIPWMSAGAGLGVQEPSCLSRALALGLWDCDDLAKMAHNVGTACVVTHKDPLCAAAASAFGRAVSLGVRGFAGGVQAFCEELATAASAHHDRLPDELRQLPRLLSWDIERALGALRCVGVPPSELEQCEGLPAHVTPVLLVALYAALKAHDFRGALLLVLRNGGEVDVTAALCGAIVGARLGTDAIPGRLRKNVLYADHLADAAARLWAARQKSVVSVRKPSRLPLGAD